VAPVIVQPTGQFHGNIVFPSLVFLNTSLTMRHRLIPEMMRSMTTRLLDMRRLFSLSSSDGLPLRGFFFQ
jgi:hypothetical protein